MEEEDKILSALIKKYIDRANVGLNKYGKTMDRGDLTLIEWLTHAQEEAMDLAIYLEKIIKQLKWEGG